MDPARTEADFDRIAALRRETAEKRQHRTARLASALPRGLAAQVADPEAVIWRRCKGTMRLIAQMIHRRDAHLWPAQPDLGGYGDWYLEQLERYQGFSTVAERRKAREQLIPCPPDGRRLEYSEVVNRAVRYKHQLADYERWVAELDVLLRDYRNLARAWGHPRLARVFDDHWRRIVPVNKSAQRPVTSQATHYDWLIGLGEDVPAEAVPF